MTKKLLLLLFVCGGSIQSNNFCMQTVRSFLPYRPDRPSMSIIKRLEAQLKAARQELQQNPSALYIAAFNNDLQKVRLLLAVGADINIKNEISGHAPLHVAALKGYTKLVEFLLQHKDSDINVRSSYEKATPLHEAVYGNQKEAAQFLLERQADVNARDKYANTPLHIAVSWSYEELIKLLLEYKANVNAQDDNGRTPLHDAESLQVLKFLLSAQLAVPSLKRLCLGQVKALGISQERFNILPPELKEALVLEPKRVLLRHALSIKDNKGRTVRDRAVEDGKQDIVDFIDSMLKSTKA